MKLSSVLGGTILLCTTILIISSYIATRNPIYVTRPCFELHGLARDDRERLARYAIPNKIGVYYINLDRSPGRERYVEEAIPLIFPGVPFTRVRGLDGANLTTLNEYIEGFHAENEVDRFGVAERLCNKTSPGELALSASHMKAITRAYEDGRDYGIVLEDDVGTQLVGRYPYTLKTIVSEMDEKYPKWEILRLTFSLNWDKWKFDDWPVYKKWKKSYDHPLAMPAPSDCCHSTVGIMYSRNGMKRVVDRYVHLNRRRRGADDDVEDHKKEDDDGEGWTYNFSKRDKPKGKQNANLPECASDHMLVQTFPIGTHFVLTPPMVDYRLAETSTGVRKKKDGEIEKPSLHPLTHWSCSRWIDEAVEMLRFNSSSDILPTGFFGNRRYPD